MLQSSATNVASLGIMLGGVPTTDQLQSWETNSPPCIGSSRGGLRQCDPCEQFFSDNSILMQAIDPANAYHVNGVVNDVLVWFMVDTEAAVSLIREDIWEKLTPKGDVKLKAWNKNLVGVEGSPLSVLGATKLDITSAGTVVSGDFLAAKALSAEAIMGLDLLESQGCVINTGQSVIHLKEKPSHLAENTKPTLTM